MRISLSTAEQNRIFAPGNLRRIILATNVAETSLTIPGIRFVIDSGLVRLSRYNPRTRFQELRVETVSQASMRQRRGRCGRLADGICVHLYSEDDAARMAEYTDPEIKRTALAGVILQMPVEGLGKHGETETLGSLDSTQCGTRGDVDEQPIIVDPDDRIGQRHGRLDGREL